MEELDLKDLFNMFWTKKVQIVLVVLIFSLIGVLYSYIYVSPKYKAYTTLVLATSIEDSKVASSETITTTDITLNNNLVPTYSKIIGSSTLIRQVIQNLGINQTEDALKKNVSVSAAKDTQYIQIDVIDEDPVQAKNIANEVAKVFSNMVAEFYNINNVHVVDKAEAPILPYNINHAKDIIIFAFIGLVVSCMYVLILNMLDTTIKSNEDVERKTGLPVLVNIPICDFDRGPRMRRGGRR